jgi:hypothetical protein
MLGIVGIDYVFLIAGIVPPRRIAIFHPPRSS